MIAKKYSASIILGTSFLVFTIFSLILFFIAPSTGHFEIDSTAYEAIARNFYYNNLLLDPNNPMNAPVFPLGYPLLMGLLYKLFGPSYEVIIWVQIFLSLLTMLLVFRIGCILFDRDTGYIAVGLMVCNLSFLTFSQMILSEVLLAFLLTFFFERLLFFVKTERSLYLIQAGLLFSFSLLVKSIALFFLPFLIIFLGMRNKNLEHILLFCISFLLPLLLYILRTYFVYGVWGFTPQAYVNMYHYFLPKVIAQVKGISFIEARNTIPFTGKHSMDVTGWKQAHILLCEYFFNYPLICVKIWVSNISKTLFGLFTTQLKVLLNPSIKGGACSFNAMHGNIFIRIYNYITFGTQSYIVIALGFFQAFWLLVRYVLVFIAFILLYQQEKYTEVILFSFFIFLCTLITGFDGCFRFRMAFESLLTVLAAMSISWLCCNKKSCVAFGA